MNGEQGESEYPWASWFWFSYFAGIALVAFLLVRIW